MKRWILCDLLGRHDFVHVAALSSQAQKIKCVRCKKYFAINYEVRGVLPWDYELEMFYRRFPSLPQEKSDG